MNKSESINKIVDALIKAQAEMPVVSFDATNSFIGNRYATLGKVIEVTRPVLTKHGLSVVQMVVSENGEIGVETILMHVSGEWISSKATIPVEPEKGKSKAQVAGSNISYIRRYALAAACGIYTDEDTDGSLVETKRVSRTAAKAEKTDENKPFTIEDACKVKSESANKLYGDMTISELSIRYNALVKALKKDGLSEEEKTDKDRKMRAAKMVIDAKRNNEI